MLCFVLAEYMLQNIPTDSRVGGRANLLDSFSISLFGIWIGTLFCTWLLHGILVYLCCVDQSYGEETYPDGNEQWPWYVWSNSSGFLIKKVDVFVRGNALIYVCLHIDDLHCSMI